MDGQTAVNEVGRQQTSEIVRGELGFGEFRAMFGQLRAELAEDLHHGGGAEHLAAGADDALEQKRLRGAGLLVVWVEPGDQGNGLPVSGVSADDRGDDVEQSANIGMTRSRSVLDGAITSRATTSPLGR